MSRSSDIRSIYCKEQITHYAPATRNDRPHLQEGRGPPFSCCENLVQRRTWHSCNNTCTLRTNNKRLHAPLICKSRACPLLRSCVRYAIAFGTFSSTRIFLKFARAAAGVTPLNNNVPSGIFSINGARWCTGQKALGYKSETWSHHATGNTQNNLATCFATPASSS